MTDEFVREWPDGTRRYYWNHVEFNLKELQSHVENVVYTLKARVDGQSNTPTPCPPRALNIQWGVGIELTEIHVNGIEFSQISFIFIPTQNRDQAMELIMTGWQSVAMRRIHNDPVQIQLKMVDPTADKVRALGFSVTSEPLFGGTDLLHIIKD